MRHSQLKAFHHVALHGGFSAAAKVLNLTQPAVSEQVRNLEKHYDVQLFRRDRKKVVLTGSGENLLRLTKQYFETEQKIEEFMSESAAAVSGELRIVVDSAYHISGILAVFNKRFPRVKVTIFSGNTEQVLATLRNFDAEIGVVGTLTPGQDMEFIDLGATEVCAFAAKDSPFSTISSLSLSDSEGLPLVFREAGSNTREKLVEEANRRGIVLKPAFVAEGREAVRAIVAAGVGIGFVSEAEYVDESYFQKIRLSDTRILINEAIIYLNQRSDVRLIRMFRETAMNVVKTR